MAETVAIATLTFLAMTLPLKGASSPGDLRAMILVATIVGTVVARRRAVSGGVLERLLYRATVATVVASVVLLFLVGVAR